MNQAAQQTPTPKKVFLVSKAGKKYEVMSFDKANNVIKLRAPNNTVFDFHDATKANITKAGYTLVSQ
jgi:uncharacterized lipoprotein YajG